MGDHVATKLGVDNGAFEGLVDLAEGTSGELDRLCRRLA
jgi:hypothetical protein